MYYSIILQDCMDLLDLYHHALYSAAPALIHLLTCIFLKFVSFGALMEMSLLPHPLFFY